MADPDDDNPWGSDGPLGRLVAAGGQVLMLGAPLKSLTLCHHAEAVADVPGKRYRDYTMPILQDGRTRWQHYRTLDTFYGVLPYWERKDLDMSSSVAGTLAEQAVEAGATARGSIDDCPLVLVDAPAAVSAITAWLEEKFRPSI